MSSNMSAQSLEKGANLSNQSQEIDYQFDSLERFKERFPLAGDKLYKSIFERHADVIKIQKAKFAIANLQKIFSQTFAISSESGFSAMSLRDLSAQTGLSMGAIYSCISKKEDIARMVSEVVFLSSRMTQDHASHHEASLDKIKASVRFHLFASTVLQPWYFFLYFETRSLPSEEQQQSTNIETLAILSYQSIIEQGIEQGELVCNDANMVANMIVVMLQDWYLKPWKLQQQLQYQGTKEQRIESYYQALMQQINTLLLPQK